MDNLLNLDLQFFADEGTNDNTNPESTNNENDATNVDVDTNTKVDTNGSEDTTLTIEDVRKMIQSENDKIRTEYSKKLKEKELELEDVRKSSMSEQERLDYENKSLQEQLNEREEALLEREEAFKRTQLELQTVDLLKEQGLPLEAKDFLVSTDIDTTTSNVDAFKVMFDNAVKDVVAERIKGTGKEHVTSAGSRTVTKEQFMKMSYQQKNQLFQTNPTLYKELNKQ